jgi:hypothetical protein
LKNAEYRGLLEKLVIEPDLFTRMEIALAFYGMLGNYQDMKDGHISSASDNDMGGIARVALLPDINQRIDKAKRAYGCFTGSSCELENRWGPVGEQWVS